MSARGAAIVSAVVFVAGVAGVAATQPRLAATTKRVKETQDVYVLPPPAQLKALTLGYRAAAIDFLWAKLLVEYGMHWSDRRPFDDLPKYIDAILEIEPDYAPLYQYVDSMIVYRPPRGYAADARLARAYLEKGIAARPHDAKVWMQYGQFVAFIGPGFLEDQEEKDRWRVDGARAMTRAVELGGQPDRAISAATILSRAGDDAAAIKSLQIAYALTENDPMERERIARQLADRKATAQRDAQATDFAYIETRWRQRFPFLSRGEYLMIDPTPNPARCAGRNRSVACAPGWGPHLPSARADLEADE